MYCCALAGVPLLNYLSLWVHKYSKELQTKWNKGKTSRRCNGHKKRFSVVFVWIFFSELFEIAQDLCLPANKISLLKRIETNYVLQKMDCIDFTELFFQPFYFIGIENCWKIRIKIDWKNDIGYGLLSEIFLKYFYIYARHVFQ